MIKVFFAELYKLLIEEKNLILTVFLPSILIFLVFVPYNMMVERTPTQRVLGVVQLDSLEIYDIFKNTLYNNILKKEQLTDYELVKIEAPQTIELDSLDSVLISFNQKYDSLRQKSEEIEEYRQRIFLSKRIRASRKKKLLEDSFEKITSIQQQADSVKAIIYDILGDIYSRREKLVRQAADSMLIKRKVDIYIVISSKLLTEGKIEYHTYRAGEFFDTELIDKSVLQAIQKIKLMKKNLSGEEIQALLTPIKREEFWIIQSRKESFDMVTGYVLPVFLAILTVISLILNTESFFIRILKDKMHHIYELMYYKINFVTWLLFRLVTFLVLGIIQMTLWIGMVYLAYFLGIIQVGDLFLLDFEKLLLFLGEYGLAYISIAIIYLIAFPFIDVYGSRYSFVIQIFRVLLFLPIIFAFIFIRNIYPILTTIAAVIPFYVPVFHIIFLDLSELFGPGMQIAYLVFLFLEMVVFILILSLLRKRYFEWYSKTHTFSDVVAIGKFRNILLKRPPKP